MGKPVLLYTSPSMYGELRKKAGGGNLGRWKLWLAAYDLGDRETTNPINETKGYGLKRGENEWTLWQYSADKNQQGPRYGLPKPPELGDRPCPDKDNPCRGIDLNVYNGTLAEMRNWLGLEEVVIEQPASPPPKQPVDVEGVSDAQDGEVQGNGETEKPADTWQPPAVDPPYPGMTNQDVLNLVYEASDRDSTWWSWVVAAGLVDLAESTEVRNKIYLGSKFENLPGLSDSQKKSLLNRLPGSEPPPEEEPGFWVTVKARKTTCCKIMSGDEARDKKGKPAMIPHEMPVELSRGDKVRVSSTHTESSVDEGNGIILAMDRVKYYLVLDSPDNPGANRTFIRKSDTAVEE